MSILTAVPCTHASAPDEMPFLYVKTERMTMRYALFVTLLFSSLAVAGQLEYERDDAKARAEHAYVVKHECRAMKDTKEADACVRRVNGYLADALKGLRRHHNVNEQNVAH